MSRPRPSTAMAIAIAAGTGIIIAAVIGLVARDSPRPATLGRLQADPAAFVGRRVSVRGTATQVVQRPRPGAPRATEGLLLVDGGAVDPPVLVVTRDPAPYVEPDTEVGATGVVRRLGAIRLAKALRRGANDALVRRYAGRPVIVASRVEATAGATGLR